MFESRVPLPNPRNWAPGVDAFLYDRITEGALKNASAFFKQTDTLNIDGVTLNERSSLVEDRVGWSLSVTLEGNHIAFSCPRPHSLYEGNFDDVGQFIAQVDRVKEEEVGTYLRFVADTERRLAGSSSDLKLTVGKSLFRVPGGLALRHPNLSLVPINFGVEDPILDAVSRSRPLSEVKMRTKLLEALVKTEPKFRLTQS